MGGDKLRCAVLGGGGMGVQNSINAESTGLAEVTAICSRRPEGGAELADLLGHQVSTYHDISQLLVSEAPELLIVAIPPYAHAGEVELAARAGSHLFLEKPIALDLERARSQVAAVREAGVMSFVHFHLRSLTTVRRLGERLREGSAGHPVLFSASYFCNSLHAPWWRDAARSGGQSVEQVIHLFDLARHLFGELEPVHAIRANSCHREEPGYTSEDVATTLLLGEAGPDYPAPVCQIASTNCAVPGEWRSRFSAVYENLTAEYDSTGSPPGRLLPVGGGNVEDLEEPTDPRAESMRAFLTAVREGDPSPVPIEEGLRTLELVLRAAEIGRS